jgi:hypothetical protein
MGFEHEQPNITAAMVAAAAASLAAATSTANGIGTHPQFGHQLGAVPPNLGK